VTPLLDNTRNLSVDSHWRPRLDSQRPLAKVRLKMMNSPKSGGPSGGPQAPSPTRRWPRLRVSRSPSPLPSPPGEGETFARDLTIRPSLLVVCLRNERQRSGGCNGNVRISQRGLSALPLLGERAGVRGNEANSNRKRTPISGTVKLYESLAEPGISQLDNDR